MQGLENNQLYVLIFDRYLKGGYTAPEAALKALTEYNQVESALKAATEPAPKAKASTKKESD